MKYFVAAIFVLALSTASQSAICHFEGGQRFCEVHDPFARGEQIIENHIVHTAPYERLDDYERGYVDGASRCDRRAKP